MGNPIDYQHGGISITIGQGVTVRFVRPWDRMDPLEQLKLLQDLLVPQQYLSPSQPDSGRQRFHGRLRL